MADIDVVPKRGTSMWLWIILAIVVIAVMWMVFGRGSAGTGVQLWPHAPDGVVGTTAYVQAV